MGRRVRNWLQTTQSRRKRLPATPRPVFTGCNLLQLMNYMRADGPVWDAAGLSLDFPQPPLGLVWAPVGQNPKLGFGVAWSPASPQSLVHKDPGSEFRELSEKVFGLRINSRGWLVRESCNMHVGQRTSMYTRMYVHTDSKWSYDTILRLKQYHDRQ